MKQLWFFAVVFLGLSLIPPAAAFLSPQIPQTIDRPQTTGTWSDEFASYDRSYLNDYPLRPLEWNATLYAGMYNHGVATWNGRQWLQLGNLEGRASALVVHQNQLYAYGQLNIAGTSASLAYWDGASWTAMPHQISFDISITLASYNNQLYLGSGASFTIDGQAIANLARWDGNQWHAADTTLPGWISTMLARPDGLYVAGSFETGVDQSQGLLRWDGNQWQTVGSPLLGLVMDLEWANDRLYVAGLFSSSTNPAINNIAAWDGTNWESFGIGISDEVHSIVFFDNALHVISVTSGSLQKLQRWNGSAWVYLTTTIRDQDSISYPEVILLNYQEQLLAFGAIRAIYYNADQFSQGSMALIWNGMQWESMTPNGLTISPRGLQLNMLATSGETVYAAGNTIHWGNGQADLVQFEAGATWQLVVPPSALNSSSIYEAEVYQSSILLRIDNQLAKVVSNTVELMAPTEFNAMAQGNNLLYIAGNFEQFNGVAAHNLITWNGIQWQALDAPATLNQLTMVEVHSNYVYISDGEQLARWDGSQWQIIATGVNRITQIEPTAKGVYAAGTFSNIDGVAAQKIAYWDGTAWSALTGVINGQIYDLELGIDGLYVAGSFSGITDGVISPGILRWTGVWHSVGGGVQYRYTPQIPIRVTQLASTPTRIYAIGAFDMVGNRYESSMIAAWDYNLSALIHAEPDYATTYRPQPVSIDVLANDWVVDGEILELTAVTSASHGTASLSGTHILYTPNSDFQGTESLSYTLRNPTYGLTSTGSLTIDVLNQFPTLLPLTYTVQPNSTTRFDVLADVVDANGDLLSITQATTTLGIVSIEQNQLRYIAPNQIFTATISYSVSDDHGGSQVGTIVVNSANQYRIFLPYTSK